MPHNVGRLTRLRTLSKFIVGTRRGCHVDELGSLSTLSGELEIRQLEKVTDPVDARNANLVQKTKLKSLIFYWDLEKMASTLSSSQENNHAQEVLEALEPPPTLRYLRIAGYGGRHFRHWLDNELILGNIVHIVFDGCKNCLELPKALGKLPLLREVEIYYMDLPRFVDYGELGSGRFLSLERLRIRGLPNLQGLSKEERTEIFPILTSLWISYCPKLTLHHCLHSIKHLHIGDCNEAMLKSNPNLQTLTSLEINNNDDSVSFPPGVLQNLSSLKKLYIGVFNELQHLHSEMLTGLGTLEELRMWGCVKLEHFPTVIFQDLNKLKTLEIKDSLRLKSLSNCFEDLAALETLEIGGCPVLAALPEALQHLTSLRSFVIYGLTNLELLPEWFGNLTSLESLTIRSCPKLESLPTSMQKLTNLHHLQIRNCPKLEQRCDPRGSQEDRHKIAHIPRVQIDSYY